MCVYKANYIEEPPCVHVAASTNTTPLITKCFILAAVGKSTNGSDMKFFSRNAMENLSLGKFSTCAQIKKYTKENTLKGETVTEMDCEQCSTNLCTGTQRVEKFIDLNQVADLSQKMTKSSNRTGKFFSYYSFILVVLFWIFKYE